ncbi:hypothetical protein [Dyella japonica]|uniref:Uncharacterized protein n=1 Tax=Dyella japonica A8 TaxID=1217721 RepID=A0A075JWT9_9GAMM|nr:hypothetical protein [Dyella japonica]AIF45942.1 hypothetical protein HY57_01000 [Dyella japonica A8]
MALIRTTLGAALVFGLAVFTAQGHDMGAKPRTLAAPSAIPAVDAPASASATPSTDGVSYPASSSHGEAHVEGDSRVNGRSDWDVDYPSQLAPQALH